jgi:hypothetical protein
MHKKYLLLSSLMIASFALSNPASAASIINGNFDTDLSGWSTVTNGGSGQWDAGKAILSTGSDVAAQSSVLVQGDDGLFSFSNPITLGAKDNLFKFDAVFSVLATDALESGGGFADNLQVWLYDSMDSSLDTRMATIDAATFNSSFSFDLSSFIGRSVAFSFELNDENDGFNSQVALNNVRIEPVPVPGALWMFVTGLFGLSGNWLRNNLKNSILKTLN